MVKLSCCVNPSDDLVFIQIHHYTEHHSGVEYSAVADIHIESNLQFAGNIRNALQEIWELITPHSTAASFLCCCGAEVET
jgi:hypothetical protein